MSINFFKLNFIFNSNSNIVVLGNKNDLFIYYFIFLR
jgi:hypothetical protein